MCIIDRLVERESVVVAPSKEEAIARNPPARTPRRLLSIG